MLDLRQQVLLQLFGGEHRAAIIGRAYAWGGMRYDVVTPEGAIVRDISEQYLRPVGRPARRVIEARS